LALFGKIWGYLAKFGIIWQNLGLFGKIWDYLAKFGNTWQNLAKFGIWQIRQIFGK